MFSLKFPKLLKHPRRAIAKRGLVVSDSCSAEDGCVILPEEKHQCSKESLEVVVLVDLRTLIQLYISKNLFNMTDSYPDGRFIFIYIHIYTYEYNSYALHCDLDFI